MPNKINLVQILEASVDRLHIGEDALPIWTTRLYHIVDVEERRYVGFVLGDFESQRKVVTSVVRRQLGVVKSVR